MTLINSIASLIQSFHVDSHDQAHQHDDCQATYEDTVHHSHEDTYENDHDHVHIDEHGYDLNGISHHHEDTYENHHDHDHCHAYLSHDDTHQHHVHLDEHGYRLNELDHNHSWRGFMGNIFKPQEVETMKPLSFSEEESHHPPVPPQIPSDFNENKTLLREVHQICPLGKDPGDDTEGVEPEPFFLIYLCLL